MSSKVPEPASPTVRLLARARRIAEFAVGQAATQGLQAIMGLLLLRWLTVDAYAQYSAATAIEATVRLLVDLGASSAIVAFVSPTTSDRRQAGAYVRAVLNFRARMFVLMVLPTAAAFVVIFRAQQWPLVIGAILFCATLASVWFYAQLSVSGSVLAVHRMVRDYYNVGALAGAGRIAVLFVLKTAHSINAVAALLVNVAAALFQAKCLHRKAARLVEIPLHADADTQKSLHAYLKPLIPLTVYFAVQGQVTLFLVSILGRAQEVAAVGALGRLAQLFTLLSAANGMLVGPAIASAAPNAIARRYALIASIALAIGSMLVGVAVFAPQPLLWLLGSRYAHLRVEVAWTVVASTVAYLGSVFYTMNVARKWVFTSVTYVGVAAQLAAQVVTAMTLDLSRAINAVYMTGITATVALIPQLVASAMGFRRSRGLEVTLPKS